MPDLTPIERPVLATIPRVELMHAGTWNISTGQATFTSDDLAQAIAAMECPAVRRPVLKIGHTDVRFDGEPAVGWIDNLNTDGSTLWGDYVGMPRWLADVCASAYPDRSIEGWYDFQCQIGHTHPFVLTGVALLGVTPPGIGTLASLQDVATLYGVAAAQNPDTVVTTSRHIVFNASGGNMPASLLKAKATVEDIRRAYYADASWSVWIEEIQLDPVLQLIVADDETGQRQRVPVTLDPSKEGEEAVEFAAPIPVLVRYEDAPIAASVARDGVVHYSTRQASRPSASPQPPATEPLGSITPQKKEKAAMAASDLNITGGLLTRLGIAPDADLDEDGLLAALDERLTAPSTVEASTQQTTPTVPEGHVVVSQRVLDEMRIQAAAGAEAFARQQREDRDNAISAAVRDGRISPARKEFWATAWDKDPEGVLKDLAALPPGRIPMAATGYLGTEASGDDSVYASLFGKDA